MHFLLLGATGRTGQHVVSELLSQGHTAAALVRTSGSLTPRPGLTVVTGSPLSKSDIKKAAFSAALTPAAAIITLNTVRESDSPFASQVSPPRFLADSCANVCEVLEQAGIRRIVVMSTAGVGDSWANLPWLSRAFMGWTNIKYALEDHGLVDKEIRLTGMDWTLVRAVRLRFDDPKQGPTDTNADVQTLDSKGDGMCMTDSVSLASAARFLVKVAVQGLFVKSALNAINHEGMAPTTPASPSHVALAAFANMLSVGSVYALSTLQTELPRLLQVSHQLSFAPFLMASLGLALGVRTCASLLSWNGAHAVVAQGTVSWGLSVACSGYSLSRLSFSAVLASLFFGGVGVGWTYLGVVVMVGQSFPTQPLARSAIGPLGFSSGTAACVGLGYLYDVSSCDAGELGYAVVAGGSASVAIGAATMLLLPKEKVGVPPASLAQKDSVSSETGFLSMLLFFNALPGMVAFSALQPLASAYATPGSSSLYYVPWAMAALALGGLTAPTLESRLGTRSTFVSLFVVRGFLLVLSAQMSNPTLALGTLLVILFGHGAGFSIIPGLVKAGLSKGTQFPDAYGRAARLL
ncbi:hypothetical protein ACJ41O_010826 [Fusarium nematophilum]